MAHICPFYAYTFLILVCTNERQSAAIEGSQAEERLQSPHFSAILAANTISGVFQNAV